MRLPVTPQISTKDGVSAKNARLTNVLKEVRKTGELAVVRPGLSLSTTYAGLGNGLIVFDGRLLVMVDDTIYDPEWEYFGWPLDSAPWSVSTTYSINDSVWYGGDLWFSWGGGNIGNTPAAGSTYWGSSSITDTWSEDTTYDIGDEVLVDGVTYYSYANSNIGNTPSGVSVIWGTTPPTSSRFYGFGSGYDPVYLGAPYTTQTCASMDACAVIWFSMLTYNACPGRPGYNIWVGMPYKLGGYPGVGGSSVTQFHQLYGTCEAYNDAGFVDTLTIYRTA